MATRLREILALDLEQVDLRRGLIGTAAIVTTIAFVAVFGIVGMTAGFAALFVVASDAPGPTRERLAGVAVMTVGGALVALVGVWAGVEHIWVATLLTFVVTATGTLAAAYGQAAATRGLLLALWAILALSLSGNDDSAGTFAAAFALGGIVATLALWLRSRVAPDEGSAPTDSSLHGDPIRAVLHSPLGWYSVLRGSAVALATALGIALFPDHAIWAALTVLLVLRPKAGETLETGVLRTLGTLAGVLVAEGLVELAGGSDTVVVVALLAAAFGMIALQKVNTPSSSSFSPPFSS